MVMFSRCLFFAVCPNGITNITASSGVLAYPNSGDYGINETKCWGIEVPETYEAIYYTYNRCVDRAGYRLIWLDIIITITITIFITITITIIIFIIIIIIVIIIIIIILNNIYH